MAVEKSAALSIFFCSFYFKLPNHERMQAEERCEDESKAP